MQKSVIGNADASTDAGNHEAGNWLDLERLARVEVSSEDELFPVENALVPRFTVGWRAGSTGPQVIRLLFENPISVRQMEIRIIDRAAERSQEFAIYAGPTEEQMREIVRQQFTFSPRGTTEEIEQYTVSLDAVGALELRIDPDRSHDPRHSTNYASLTALRLR